MLRSITPFIAGALLLTALLWLGFWQLERAGEKRALQEAFASSSSVAAAPIDAGAPLLALPRFTPVRLTGRYDSTRQALLDAQVHDGHAGYRVWTPFTLANGDRILVDRGWVRASPDRNELPDVAVAEFERSITGHVAPLPQPGIRVGGGVQETEGWPRRLAWPDASALQAAWGHALPPVLVLLADGEADGFVRDWNPVRVGPERHIGYAVQWFALALTLAVIIIVLTIRSRKK
ncbi:MAG: SURF1 family protein [Xanthomonadaceae bacterium]|nr:SURF1 family protein [Xanthomonadaceae bacterium]